MVLSVYDLIAIDHPHLCKRLNALYYGLMIRHSIKSAAVILVPSDWTRQRLVNRLGINDQKITLLPPNVDDDFVPPGNKECSSPYILFTGNLEPKKNLPYLIEAYDLFRQRTGLPHRLVLVGRAAWGYDPIYQAAGRSPYCSDIVFRGYLPRPELVNAYQQADLFIFPSLTEGFGLPPIEAMACGVPVIVSDQGALPEATDGAAHVFAWRSDTAEPLAEAMACVLQSPERQAELRTAGFERVRCLRAYPRQQALREMLDRLGVEP